MPGVVDKLLARKGLTRADINPKTHLGKSLRGKAVPNSHELQRIIKLPRRVWQEDPDQKQLEQALSVLFRLPESNATLFPEQARVLWELTLYRGVLGWLPVGVGKAQPVTEPILTPNGWVEIGQLHVGDQIIGRNGHPYFVTGVFPQGLKSVYRLDFTDGSFTHSCAEHLWTFKSYDVWYTKPLSYLLGRRLRSNNRWRAHTIFMPMCDAVQYPHVNLPLDPYTLGALIGDGGVTQATINFTSMDSDIVKNLVLPGGVCPRPTKCQSAGLATQYNLTRAPSQRVGSNPLVDILKHLGLHGCRSEHKFIPEMYLRASIDQRISLLQGLMDTDGTVDGKGRIGGFSSSSFQLISDMQELVESLGGTARIGFKKTTHLDHYRCSVILPEHIPLFRCARKADRYRPVGRQRKPLRALTNITEVGYQNCVCISVSAPDRLYLTRHHIPTHNSLTGYLAQCALESKRMLLLLPANLQKEKTPKELIHYRKDWHIPEFRTMSYETLSRKDGESKLRAFDPDLIVADECQALKNPKAALVRKLSRFFDDYPDIPFLPMTGTPLSGGLEGLHHLQKWALPPELRILPDKKEQMLEWAYALDFKVDLTQRLGPGALTQLCKDRQEASSLDGVRTAIGRRFVETPGVVSSPAQDCPANITISSIYMDLPKVVEDAFEGIHELAETPDGHSFAEAAQGWAHMHECALGFFYRWNPRAPKDWMDARKGFHKQIREILATNRRGLDSMLMVVNAIDRGEYDPEPLERWRKIQPSFKPNPEAVWFDDTALKICAKWLKEPGLCWVYHREFGKRLSELTGVPYYGAGGKDPEGVSIEHVDGGPAILSLTSNKFGRNLQERWSRNLVTYWPPTALDSEQFMGRTHRKGQLKDNVSFEVLIGCRVQWENITKARFRAVDEQQKTHIKQKLLLGDYLVAEPIGKGYLWK